MTPPPPRAYARLPVASVSSWAGQWAVGSVAQLKSRLMGYAYYRLSGQRREKRILKSSGNIRHFTYFHRQLTKKKYVTLCQKLSKRLNLLDCASTAAKHNLISPLFITSLYIINSKLTIMNVKQRHVPHELKFTISHVSLKSCDIQAAAMQARLHW